MLVTPVVRVNFYLALPDDIETLLAEGLVHFLLGSEHEVLDVGGDDLLEVLAPATKEKDRGVDHRQRVLLVNFCISKEVLFLSYSLNLSMRLCSSSGSSWKSLSLFWLMRKLLDFSSSSSSILYCLFIFSIVSKSLSSVCLFFRRDDKAFPISFMVKPKVTIPASMQLYLKSV